MKRPLTGFRQRTQLNSSERIKTQSHHPDSPGIKHTHNSAITIKALEMVLWFCGPIKKIESNLRPSALSPQPVGPPGGMKGLAMADRAQG